jgi:hypothetical protein
MEGADMTDYFYARAAARLLVNKLPADPNQRSDDESRAVSVAAIEREILDLARSRRARSPRIWLAAAAGLALVVGVGVGWHHIALLPGAPQRVSVHVEGQRANYTLLGRGVTGTAVEVTEVLPGDRVQTNVGSGTTLVLSTGTRVAIAGQSDVQLREIGASQRFWLESGGVRATVAKLGPHERFLVQTSDSEIEVRGTVFSVKVEPHAVNGGRTRVCLEEGVVIWRQAGRETKMIASDGHWVGCEATAGKAGIAPAGTTTDGSNVERPKFDNQTGLGMAQPKVRTREVPAVVAKPSGKSSLAEQNDLFSAAMTAEREGDLALASARLEELLARYPDGSLAESAKAEVARLRRSKMPSATDF